MRRSLFPRFLRLALPGSLLSLAMLTAPSAARADDFVLIKPNPKPSAPAVPAPAWPACGDDMVILHDGGMIRGVISELRPREQVTLQLATGKVVVVPWSEIHHVEQGGPVGRTCGADHSPTASAALDDTGTLTLVIAEKGYTLEAQNGTEWEEACRSPCERIVPRNGFYRITGSGIQTSTNFRVLGAQGDRVVLHVNAGNSGVLGLGVLTVTLGGLAACVGYVMLPAQAASYRNDVNWPLPTMLVGGVLSFVGAFMIEANIKTKVGQEAYGAERPPAGPATPGDHPAIRVMPFKEARNDEPKLRGLTLPVLSGRF